MQDIETNSLWAHVTGEGIMGEMDGRQLELFPSSMSTYALFKTKYPMGQLLAKPEKGDAGSNYAKYSADSTRLGLFGRLDNFEQLPGKAIVYGINWQGKQVALAHDYLNPQGYDVLDNFTSPIIVVYKLKPFSMDAYVQEELNRSGDIQQIAQLMTDGSFDYSDWKKVSITSAYWFAWISFFPNTELIK
jgi:hypothetical protein